MLKTNQNIKKLNAKKNRLKASMINLDAEINKLRARRSLRCGCGKRHPINKLTFVQTHWYESPHGCTSGDTWHYGEYWFLCPTDPEVYVRLLFNSKNNVPYEKRGEHAHSASSQFYTIHKDLFKDQVHHYEGDRESITRKRGYTSFEIDEDHEAFEIDIGYSTKKEKK